LNAACAKLRAWKQRSLPELILAINISARFFQLDHISERLLASTEQYGVSMQSLELEVTEGMLIEDIEKAMATLGELRELGFHISIDDFGTGYSSLSYLKQLPIHKLKIDQSFVHNCANDPVDAALVKSIISMAHNLKLLCIAEGVETREQLEFLREHGCDQIQGFYYSKPLAAKPFEEQFLL
jgi:EAL domain-containing protein (putative c-di-GMP-specific phosphodiesterase class I)